MIAVAVTIYGFIFSVSASVMIGGFYDQFPKILLIYLPCLFGVVLYFLAKPLAAIVTWNL
jgi:hypothetical protein